MFESLLLILPVFLIIALGVILDILHVLPKQTSSVIGAYVLYVALPMLLVHILTQSSFADILHGGFWAGLLLTQLCVCALAYCGDLFLSKRGHGPAASFAMSCSFPNVAFIGLPVIASLFPGNHQAMVAAGLAVIAPNLVAIPSLVQMEFMKHSQEKRSVLPVLGRALFFNPLVLGTCVGFLLGAADVTLWAPLNKAVILVGNTTAPCMLLTLGLDLRDKVRVAFSGTGVSMPRIATATLVKLVLMPLLAWFLLALFGVGGVWLAVGVIMSGTATALVSYVIAEIYGHAPEEAALIAVVTNVLNLFTLTLLAGLLRSQDVF